jgi:uncharacterized integral membrane protein (TIGR00698 family)
MPSLPADASGHGWQQLPRLLPGLLTALPAVAAAFALHALVPALPAMTLAVILGLLAANLPAAGVWVAGRGRPGLDFSGKHFMRAGIVLLGLKVSIPDVLGLGWLALVLITAVVLASFAGTYGIARLFRLQHEASLLIATGFSICGASAIGAMAAVRRIRHADTVLPVALVTLCGTLAIGVMPLLIHPLRLSPQVFGAWTGASVHDVGQVVATAQTAGTSALAIAVVVKLTRVILLAPVVAAAGVQQRFASIRATRAAGQASSQNSSHNGPGQNAPGPDGTWAADPTPAADGGRLPPLVPLFVVGFMAMVVLRSTGWLSPGWLDAGAAMQELLLGLALFSLGSAVRMRTLLRTGSMAVLAALGSWFLIALLGLGAALLMVQS